MGFNYLHSTLLSACQNDQGSGLNEEEEEEIIPENNKSNSSCPPCTEFSIRREVAKHLRSCPVPRVNLPPQFNNLIYSYKDMEASIKNIRHCEATNQ